LRSKTSRGSKCSIWETAGTGRRRHGSLTSALSRLIAAGGLDPVIVDTPPFQSLRVWNAITKMLEAATVARTLPRDMRVIVNWLRAFIRTGSSRRSGRFSPRAACRRGAFCR